MNNIYKVIWDKNLCCWKVVSELASSLITKSRLVGSVAILISSNAVADVSMGESGEILFSGTTTIDNRADVYGNDIIARMDSADINIINGGGLNIGLISSSSAADSISVKGNNSYLVADGLSFDGDYGESLPYLNISDGGTAVVDGATWNISVDGSNSALLLGDISLMHGENLSVTNGAKAYVQSLGV